MDPISSHQDNNEASRKSPASFHQSKGTSGPSKLGRRGDPRMHRAVKARLDHPDLSLLDALRVGGFQFPDDCSKADDASIVDVDGVALGQRKNQLSRRCRLARKGGNHSSTHDSPVSSPGSVVHDGGDRASEISQLQRLMHAPTATATNKASGEQQRKRSITLLSRAAGNPGDDDDESPDDSRMAKYHPQYHPLVIPPKKGPGSSALLFAGGTVAPTTSSAVQHTTSSGTTTSRPTNANPSDTNLQNGLFQQQEQHPHVSGVAVASLSQTAAAAGLTLEQLAMTLSSSSPEALHTLASKPATTAVETLANDPRKRALLLFRLELRPLLSRCMSQAGYSVQDAREGSAAFWQFAIQAWQTHGQCLQREVPGDLLQDETVLEAPTDMSPALPVQRKEQQEQQQQHGHDHDHAHVNNHSDRGHDCSVEHECLDGRHLHDLAGTCGHRAIVHKPEGGRAHVDFVLGNKVECYEDVSVGRTSGTTVWPSAYKCQQLDCPKTNEQDHTGQCNWEEDCKRNLPPVPPKTFELNDINLDGGEWNFDFFDQSDGQRVDEGILGMFRLGSDEGGTAGATRTSGSGSSTASLQMVDSTR